MKKRIIALLAVMCLMALALAACGKSTTPEPTPEPAPEVTTEAETTEVTEEVTAEPEAEAPVIAGNIVVKWWGGDSRHEITQKAIDLFTADFPEVTVEPRPMGGSDYWTSLDTELAGGNAPDVLQFGGNFSSYVQAGQLEPLNDYIDKGLIDTTNIDQAMLDAITVDGKIYGLCLGANRIGIVYNKTMLDKAGIPLPGADFTWDSFKTYLMDAKAKLDATDEYKGVYPMFDASLYETNTFGYYAAWKGNKMYTGGDTTDLKEETVKSFLDMWADYRDNGLVPPATVSFGYTEKGADTSALVEGKVAMTILYSNQVIGWQDAMTDELGISPLPEVNSNVAWIMPSQYFCINAASSNKDTAAAFINFFVNSREVGDILRNDRGISVNSDVREAIAMDATPLDQTIYDLFDVLADHTSPMDPNVPHDQEFLEGYDKINGEVAYGKKTTEDAAKEIVALLKELIVKP